MQHLAAHALTTLLVKLPVILLRAPQNDHQDHFCNRKSFLLGPMLTDIGRVCDLALGAAFDEFVPVLGVISLLMSFFLPFLKGFW